MTVTPTEPTGPAGPRRCWCGHGDVEPYAPGYGCCSACGTLVSTWVHSRDVTRVLDDAQDFYGHTYWYAGQTTSAGANTIEMRARTDLVDRVPHWIRTLLSHIQPPGRVLELGSSHGGFVAMLRLAGFDAVGLEVSPAIVELAKTTFDVPVLLGPVEDQAVPPASFDAIVLMDVLEHLPDPAGTVASAGRLLKPDGVLLIQTPEYPGGSREDLTRQSNRFVEMLIPDEHLYLFNRDSFRRLLIEAGFPHLTFEPAVFGHYDMFAVASREARLASTTTLSETLQRSPGGRVVLALLDLADARERAERQCAAILPLQADVAFLTERLGTSEADRAARLSVIEQQGADLGSLRAAHHEAQARADALAAHLAASDADRQDRLRVIERQGDELGRLAAAGAELEARLRSVEAQLEASEQDRTARLDVIQAQGGELERLRSSWRPTAWKDFGIPREAEMSVAEARERENSAELQARIARLEAAWTSVSDDRSARINDIGALAAELDTVRRQVAEVSTLLDAVRAGSMMKLARLVRPGGVDAALARASEILNRARAVETAADPAPRQAGDGGDVSTPPLDALSAQIRDPKTTAPFNYTPESLAAILHGLEAHGFEVRDIRVDPAAYRAYFDAAGYTQRYPGYYSFNLPEKSLEHFVAAQLLGLSAQDVYIDIASEHSPVPEIYSRLFGCKSYRQDLAYRAGLHGDEIGGDAAAMPVPDGFATAMALHCSFEHFEGDADERFIREIGRVLNPGGRVCFAPLYLWHEYGVLTDPAVALAEGVEFNPDAVVYCKPGWGNRHGRLYDAAHLDSRIRRHLDGLQMTLYRVVNATDVHESCYLQFALTIARP